MTKRIEEVLDLPSLESLLGDDMTSPEQDQMIQDIANALESTQDEIEKSLIDPDGSREHAREMDEIHDAAMVAHKDLVDMAFNMEPKNAGSIFEPAARFLELALKASQNKTDARMKSIELKIKKEKHDYELKRNQNEGVIEGETQQTPAGTLADRNQLLRQFKDKS